MALKKRFREATRNEFRFIFAFFCVLMFFNTVATSLYLYFSALCQVIASYDKGSKSCDVLSRKQILSLDRKIRIKSPDHLFGLNIFDSVLYTIVFRAYVLSFLIRVAEVPRKNYLLPAGLFFTDSVLFCLSFILRTLRLLFLCKNLLEILRNSILSRISLCPARNNYTIMGTNFANRIMMSYV